MEVFIQQLINGITLGSIYGLIAIGYTMVFGILGMVNFAHGDVFMVSAFIALIAFLILTTWVGVGSIALALVFVLIAGMLLTPLGNWATATAPLPGGWRARPGGLHGRGRSPCRSPCRLSPGWRRPPEKSGPRRCSPT